jgi:SAM-dependent methyltransferase
MLYENPDIYDALLPAAEPHLNFYLRLARQCAGPVLELACGSGQFTVPIARQQANVVGLDRSSDMLAAARRRRAADGSALELVHGDMRNFDLNQRFSLIFIARNSLLHLHELDDFAALFSAVRRHLAPGGLFAFDIFNPNLRMLTRPAGERYSVMRVASEDHGELVVDATNDYDPLTQVNRSTWFISAPDRPDAWIAPLHLRSIFPQELRLLLAANQFRLISRDGDFTGSEFVAESPRQVCQCHPV